MIKKILFILPLLCLVSWLYAGTISVSTLNDSGTGSLRQAITDATAGDVISIDIAGTITLSSELPTINRTITITGNSAGTIIDGNSSCRIFTVQLATGTVTLSGLNLMNGYSSIGAAAGLFAITGNNALVAISNCTFSGCSTTGSEAYGGAIATSADMTLTNCTFYGNTAATSGGALATLSSCTVSILNCTIYNNGATSSSGTGGLDVAGGAVVSVQNTILAGNTAESGTSYSDLLTSSSGVLNSLGYNLSNTAPFSGSSDLTGKDLSTEIKISALALNAASGMYVCALQSGSVAIDQANSTTAPTLDQCGQSRLGNADIGAFENQILISATVTTQAVSNISTTTATGNGNITSIGSPIPTQYGVVWSTSSGPNISLLTKTEEGAATSTGAFSSSITGLIPNTIYYVRAYATNTAGTAYGDEVSFTTGAASSSTFETAGNWSAAGNWSDGVPGTVTTAIIAANCIADSSVEVAALTIDSGLVLTIAPNEILEVTGTLTNNYGTAGLVFKSDSTGTGMLMNNTTGVQATVQQYLKKDQWHYMGIPVSYVPDANKVFHNCYVAWIDESLANNSSSSGWQYLSAGDSLKKLHGYAVQYNRGTWGNNDTTIAYTGILNTGILDSTFNNDNDGWNFISNPYPITVDWDASSGITLTNCYNAIYLWNPDSCSGTGAYGSYGSYISGGSTNGQTRYIAPMQGFFLKAWAESAAIEFTNSAKVAQTVDFKNATVETQIKLAVTDNDINYDEMLFRVIGGSSTAFDGSYDAQKLIASSKQPQLYSVLNGVEYSINSVPEITENSVVPLKVLVKTTGAQKLVLRDLENYNYSYPISLMDASGNYLTNLATTDYSFSAEAGETVSFYLAFTSESLSNRTLAKSDIYLTTSGQNLVINNLNNNLTSEVTISNVNGQSVYQNKVTAQKLSIPVNRQGIYIVKVIGEDGVVFNGKAIINF